ncbi:MAG: helix-turn-helix transcriptional regulator [Acutalibacteraceae bacterium]|nr:helix-turn-helix transcriptional regulator [Acutalibacteraceae bacterium]
MKMSERIAALRRELNLTQAEFGKKVGVARNTIATYESGVREPKDSVLLMMTKEFKVDIDWLKTGRGDMFLTVPEDAIDDFAVEFGLTDIAKEFLREFVKFSANDQREFLGYLKRLFPHAAEPEK